MSYYKSEYFWILWTINICVGLSFVDFLVIYHPQVYFLNPTLTLFIKTLKRICEILANFKTNRNPWKLSSQELNDSIVWLLQIFYIKINLPSRSTQNKYNNCIFLFFIFIMYNITIYQFVVTTFIIHILYVSTTKMKVLPSSIKTIIFLKIQHEFISSIHIHNIGTV